MHRQQVLLIELEQSTERTLTGILNDLGCEVLCAREVRQALDFARRTPLAMAVLGFSHDIPTHIGALRSGADNHNLPVLVLVESLCDIPPALHAALNGPIDYQTAPCDPYFFRCKIRLLLELNQQRCTLQLSNELIEATGRMARVGGWHLSIGDGNLFWSDETRRIHEVPADYQPTVEGGIAFYTPEVQPLLREALQRAATSGEDFDLELPFVSARNNRLWVRAMGQAIRNGDEITAVRGVFQDITRAKSAEEALRQHRDKLRELVAKRTRELETERRRLVEAQELARLGSWEWEIAQDHISGSAEFYRLFRSSPQRLQTLDDFLALLLPEESKVVRRLMPRTIRSGAPFERDVSFRLTENEEITVHLRGRFVSDRTGRSVRMIGTCVDITERKAIEETLRASEELLNETGRLAKIGGWSIDLRTNHLSWTRATYDLHEVDSHFTPTVATAIAFYAPESRPRIEAAVGNAIRHGEPFDLQLDLITAKGRRLRVHAIGRSHRDGSGRIVRVSGTFQDITEQQQAAAALEQALTSWQTTFDAVEDSICLFDADHHIVHYNRASHRLLINGDNLHPEVLCYQVVHGSDAPIESCPYQRARQSHRREQLDLAFDDRWYEVTVDPVFAADGSFSGAVHLLRDVTERRLMQMRLHEAQMQLVQQEKLAMVGQLAAGVAHEINNPLGIISQATQTIARRLAPEVAANLEAAAQSGLSLEGVLDYLERRKILELLSAIDSGVIRAVKIIDNLLQFSRRSREGKSPCSMIELVEQALSLANADYDLTRKFDFRAIVIERDFAADLPHIPVVAVEIEQVILNLIKNAAQAQHGVEQPLIRLKLECNGREVRFEIKDNGPGIPEELQQRIFEPFFTTKEVGVGTGLGLSVSRMIVTQNHHGRIEVASTPGNGACFTVRLPLTPEGSVNTPQVTP